MGASLDLHVACAIQFIVSASLRRPTNCYDTKLMLIASHFMILSTIS